MSSTSKHRNTQQRDRRFKLHPATHAVRHALALGLAMATAQPALAGTCDVAIPTSATCNGDFLDASLYYAIDDLTLVVGGDLPTTIQQFDGSPGVGLYAAVGSITLSSFADILATTTGSSAIGIHVATLDGDASVTNAGHVIASTTGDVIGAMEVHGIYAASNHGDVTVVSSGSVDVSAGGSVGNAPYVYASINATGITGSSEYGNVTIENAGGIQIGAPATQQYSSSIFGIVAHSGSGDLSVTNTDTGVIDVAHPYGYANGISAYTHSGSIAIDNAGAIGVASDFGSAVGIAATSKYGDGAVGVANSGSIDVVGYSATFGIIAKSDMTATVVDNTGSMTVESMQAGNATGISAQAKYGDVMATNGGDIAASSHDTAYARGAAIGISALTVYDGDIHIDNTGSLSANAYAANGVVATAKYGDVAITNAAGGSISVDGARTIAVNATSKYDGSVLVDNAGAITAAGRYEAVGVYAHTMYGYGGANPGTVSVNNTGTITASSTYWSAMGVVTDGYSGTAVTNAGDISATGYQATGVLANSYFGVAELTNTDTGTISATGVSRAMGAVVYASETARLINDGTISSEAHNAEGYAPASATAYGSFAVAGLSVTLNYGTITADATVDGAGTVLAYGAVGYGGGVTIVNEGTIAAHSAADSGVAASFGAYAYAEFSGIYNYGDITAVSDIGNGSAYAFAVIGNGVNGSTFYNVADTSIAATANAVDGNAQAMGLNQAGFYIGQATNAGDISATASVAGFGYATAVGLANFGVLDAIVGNTGSITASAYANQVVAEAIGVDNLGVYYDTTVTNDGQIGATAATVIGYAYATGVRNSNYYALSLTTNSGDIVATATTGWGIAEATAVDAFGLAYGGSITNTGTIAATAVADRGYAYANGTFIYSPYGDAATSNTSVISADASAHGEYGKGVAIAVQTVANSFGPALGSLVNHGDIVATATSDGNFGFASATAAGTIGKYVVQENYGNIVAQATGTSQGFAFGSYNSGWDGVTDTNTGTIAAHANAGFYAAAHGVIDNAYSGGFTMTVNHGDIVATADVPGDYSTGYGGVAYAFAVEAKAKYNADFTSDGSIVSSATAPFGLARSIAVEMDSHKGNSTFGNAGSIQATASAYHYDAIAIGVDVEARYDSSAVNDGSIQAHATADYSDISALAVGFGASSWGIEGHADVVNHGDVVAQADAMGGKAYSVGVGAMAAVTTLLQNDGTIGALSQADGGLAIARGAYAHSTGSREFLGCAPDYSVCYYANTGGALTLDNHGDIAAQSDAAAGAAFAYGSVAIGMDTVTTNGSGVSALARADDGNAVAIGSVTFGNTAGLDNAGDIQAAALAANGTASATGALVSGDFAAYANAVWYFYATIDNVDSHAYNAGGITAFADAGTGIATATGLATISQSGNVAVTNAGDLIAQADGGAGSVATGVRMDSIGANSLLNTGSIVATGTNASHIAVWSGDAATATIDNQGLLAGSVRTGMLDDSFTNGANATWNTDGISDFGAGDDIVSNSGTLRMQDATITLGDAGAAGNQFANTGLLLVAGDSRIDMGAGNAFAFTNDGMIDFRDGAPDDILHIGGDLAGSGHLQVDMSGLHGTSDVLYVEGNVATGSVHTIDVNLLDMPTTATSHITVAHVAGTSTADDFVLGDLRYGAGNFLALAFSPRVVGTIDAAGEDLFSLDINVTGLNDTGALGAAIAPGAQSLMATQIGTFRQRMGLLSQVGKGSVDAWARVFRNEGTIDPEQKASNFGQGGRFAFEQRNSGVEVGVGYGFAPAFSAGVLLSKADGHQHLDDGGIGSSKLDGDTYGVYGTWLSPDGFYLDASYRRMRFDARLQSAAGDIRGHGDASAFNLEGGYAWKLESGLTFEPQLQYTRTDVDRTDALAGGVSAFRAEGGTASTGRVGVMVRQAFGDAAGTTWTPYLSLNAVREFDGRNDYSINGVFLGTTSTGGTSVLADGGVDLRISDRTSLSGSVQWQDGGALDGVFGGQLALRFHW